MTLTFDKELESFITYANKNCVKMIMVGGGAVNFHGYQRHSADVDFKQNFFGKNKGQNGH